MKGYFISVFAFFSTLISANRLAEIVLQILERAFFRLSGFRRSKLSVGGHRIIFLSGGHGPTLLLIHGFGGDKTNWIHLARALKKSYRILIPDLPGFGSSSKDPKCSYDVENQTKRIFSFCRKANAGPHHVLGHSMGGQIAAIYARRYPEHILSLTLIAPAGITAPKKSPFFLGLENEKNFLTPSSATEYGKFLDVLFFRKPRIPRLIQWALSRRFLGRSQWHQKIFGDLIDRYTPLEPILPHIKLPVFLIWGAQDQILDVSSLDVMKPLLPRCRAVTLEPCGHMPMLEKPVETARLIHEFLSEPENLNPEEI